MMPSDVHHCISMSGGKDSTATALLALEQHAPSDCSLLFADTGHEHELTYEYLEYLADALGLPVITVKADFTEELKRKARITPDLWAGKGVSAEVIASAVEVFSNPTGIPFLDLCILRGRFPSPRSRFCTYDLKVLPLVTWQLAKINELHGSPLISWQGIRADESLSRRDLLSADYRGAGIVNYRPILSWSADDVFASLAAADIKPNPLYKMGFSRVGCMPCIMSRKGDIREVAARFPEVIERLDQWEHVLMACNKTGYSSFFMPKDGKLHHTPKEFQAAGNIHEIVRWANTSHGGRQFGLPLEDDVRGCSSAYGLCE